MRATASRLESQIQSVKKGEWTTPTKTGRRRAQEGAGRRAQSAERRAQGSAGERRRAQESAGERRRAQNAERRTQGAGHRAQGAGRRAQGMACLVSEKKLARMPETYAS